MSFLFLFCKFVVAHLVLRPACFCALWNLSCLCLIFFFSFLLCFLLSNVPFWLMNAVVQRLPVTVISFTYFWLESCVIYIISISVVCNVYCHITAVKMPYPGASELLVKWCTFLVEIKTELTSSTFCLCLFSKWDLLSGWQLFQRDV